MNINCTGIMVYYLEVGDTDPNKISDSFIKTGEAKPTQKVHNELWEPKIPFSLNEFVDREAGVINVDPDAMGRIDPDFVEWVKERHSFHRIIYMECKYEAYGGRKSPNS